MERLVRRSANHPSVVMFGFLNEGDGAHPASTPVFKELTDTVKKLDSGRLVSWAEGTAKWSRFTFENAKLCCPVFRKLGACIQKNCAANWRDPHFNLDMATLEQSLMATCDANLNLKTDGTKRVYWAKLG